MVMWGWCGGFFFLVVVNFKCENLQEVAEFLVVDAAADLKKKRL